MDIFKKAVATKVTQFCTTSEVKHCKRCGEGTPKPRFAAWECKKCKCTEWEAQPEPCKEAGTKRGRDVACSGDGSGERHKKPSKQARVASENRRKPWRGRCPITNYSIDEKLGSRLKASPSQAKALTA